ncbi:hypothetical protein [Streptomyces sp. NPDC047028]|uniref:hypothetical protein n=1 Tax=Streptomyces sp. NPDC047028 TaxID=3155793 RepID=UPI00340D1A70
MGKRKRRTGMAVGIGAGILGLVGAATVIGSANAAPESGGRHCAANVDNGQEKCFKSLLLAQKYAQQNIKDNAAGAQTSVLKPSDVVIGTLFTDFGFGGDSMTLWGSHPCQSNGKANFYFNLPDSWKGRLSSVQSWARCDIVLHTEPYMEGASSSPFRDLTPQLDSTWNDKAQSIEFR